MGGKKKKSVRDPKKQGAGCSVRELLRSQLGSIGGDDGALHGCAITRSALLIFNPGSAHSLNVSASAVLYRNGRAAQSALTTCPLGYRVVETWSNVHCEIHSCDNDSRHS